MSEFSAQKNDDWHRADIVCGLRKRGWSLRRLSKANGYSSASTLKTALDRPWPKGEKIIANAIGVSPCEIWPSRYLNPIKKTHEIRQVGT